MAFKSRIVKFGEASAANELSGMSSDEIDELAFGAIEIDASGTIMRYNAAEGEISGRDPSQVIGQNFFTEVAPCTNTDEFQGRFQEGVEADGLLNTTIVYTFDYEMTPTQVRVQMLEADEADRYWILVKRV